MAKIKNVNELKTTRIMNYDTMTIESLADDCFRKSGYKINKADLISRITHLCENHKSKVNFVLGGVSKCQHPYKKVISGDDGMYCTECNKYITTF